LPLTTPAPRRQQTACAMFAHPDSDAHRPPRFDASPPDTAAAFRFDADAPSSCRTPTMPGFAEMLPPFEQLREAPAFAALLIAVRSRRYRHSYMQHTLYEFRRHTENSAPERETR